MNWVDAAILITIGLFGFLGWKNGIIKWVSTLAGAIIGIIFAGQYYARVAELIPIDTDFDKIVAFTAIFIVSLIFFWVLANFVKKILNMLFLGWVDRSIGALIGIVVGLLSVSAIASIAVIVPIDSLHLAIAKSSLLESILTATDVIKVLLPSQFDQMDRIFEEGLDWKNQFSG
ncbi:MAG: hypothetical protein CL777_03565 [Chloroflexi bacterium]|nr:hypothetical protein [Chloroflexota bacterium]|tara:strand:- start:13918 stop:14439 length:522 start_codon:yes stop_codon:yes gene_type:complete